MPRAISKAVAEVGAGLFTALLLATVAAATALANDRAAFASIYSDQQVFLQAIAAEAPRSSANVPVTGISVPHHLPAADLIARGFWAAAENQYDRIIVLAPDHFRKSRRPLATTRRDFETVFGLVANDRTVSGALLAAPDLFDDSDLFADEHGIAALLPFIKHFFPAAKSVPIALSSAGTRAEWDRAFSILEGLIGPNDLIVQSTDYSHYLPLDLALQRDQETLSIIAANDVESIIGLVQPDHMDSKAAQYLQMRLQRDFFRSNAMVVANRNSDPQGRHGPNTTSYIVTVYAKTAAAGARLRYPDQSITYFGGDTFSWTVLHRRAGGPSDCQADRRTGPDADRRITVDRQPRRRPARRAARGYPGRPSLHAQPPCRAPSAGHERSSGRTCK